MDFRYVLAMKVKTRSTCEDQHRADQPEVSPPHYETTPSRLGQIHKAEYLGSSDRNPRSQHHLHVDVANVHRSLLKLTKASIFIKTLG